ncbi:MAG: hypothetical protein KTR26_17885 [Flammeovirgaceae bacterium]|nr:hypothetical protein [Flammeovirgaceae bacterium]
MIKCILCQFQKLIAAFNSKGNVLLISKKASSFFPGKSGGGLFNYAPELVLTNPYQEISWNRSLWQLPKPFFQNGKCRLSYHENKIGTSIKGNQKKLCMQSVARGQEFIINTNQSLINWVQGLSQFIK